jgi:hypothetical protein
MIETTATSARPAAASTVSGPRTLDDLAELDVTALEAVYRRGTVPSSLHALDGNPVCRMLSVRGLDSGGRAGLVRNLARASARASPPSRTATATASTASASSAASAGSRSRPRSNRRRSTARPASSSTTASPRTRSPSR